ncbi:MAG: tetratricopeptide repeat protein [Nitrospiria bacterium]
MEDLTKKNKEAFLIRIPGLKTHHCLDTNLIGLYLEKKLSIGESSKVEEHIKECLFCLNQLNELQEMIVIEKTAEPLTQNQQERFNFIFQEKIKKDSEIKESSRQTILGSIQQTLQQIADSFSSWNLGWKTAMAMVLITMTSVYFTVKVVNSGHEVKTVLLSSRISHEVERSEVKVSLLDESGKRFRETEGFVINSNGLILTNLSEMNRAHSAQVTLNDGISYLVEGVQSDEARNLAFLKINRNDLIPLKGSTSPELTVGENLIQIGDLSNPSRTSSYATVTNFISSSRKTSSGQQYLQLVNQSSTQNKGILVNRAGETVGLVISRQENISYAVLFKPGDDKGMLGDFKPVSSIDSKRPDTGEAFGYYFKGIMAYDAMDYEKSASYLKHAVDLNPNLDGARVTLGTLFSDEGKVDQAIKEYEAALEANPKNTDALYYLARAKDQIGKYDEAIQVFEKALQIDPRDKDLLFELGIDYVTQGNMKKAQEQYEVLKTVDVGNAKKLMKLIEMGIKTNGIYEK